MEFEKHFLTMCESPWVIHVINRKIFRKGFRQTLCNSPVLLSKVEYAHEKFRMVLLLIFTTEKTLSYTKINFYRTVSI